MMSRGGPQPHDDNGKGNGGGSPAGHAAYAELSINPGSLDFSALGNLPEHTKLAITYKGKTVIAEKLDVGGGGAAVNGKPRAIDLWWETAKLLDFTNGTDVVNIRAVAPSTATTPVDGQAVAASGATTTSPSTSLTDACSCPTGGAGGAVNTTLTGNGNVAQAFNFFVSNGFTAAQAAGIVGNLSYESTGVDPQRVEGDGDSATPTGQGWGIAQFTPPSNAPAIQQAAGISGPVDALLTQLEMVLDQLTGKAGSYNETQAGQEVKSTSTPQDAAAAFQGNSKIGGPYTGYERPGDESQSLAARQTLAQQIFQKNGNVGGSNNSGGGGCAAANSTVSCTSGTPSGTSGLSQTRQNVVCIAQQELALWKSGKMTAGFRANSPDSFSKYSQNSDELWCADFASWVYKQAGDPLQSASSGRIPTVDGIIAVGQQSSGSFHYHDASGYTPKPGDLVIHKSGESHVNIVVAVKGNTMTLVGGDQVGPSFPDGSIVSEYTVSGFSGTDGITGYVSPD